ncbi:ACT domain-containing protein [Pleionea litopenaei]|uniref:ACT domain-containing protein n=1 Tax=Pleionea litopenaei TaxID=3070815 RepID=A0AA51RRZ8_9GAMM|nr:ACT domain-containing protein [Pleionea sp. HL-JVS1]WMS86541.1 ACT domain-containing protein [Pleionea sp. HL-JVS1]
MTNNSFPILHLQTEHSIAKLKEPVALPAKSNQLYNLSVTVDEISLIAPTQFLRSIKSQIIKEENGWHIIKFDQVFQFKEIGVLAAVAARLAEHDISILAVSTFNTDYLMIQQTQIGKALMQMRAAGHQVTSVHQLG